MKEFIKIKLRDNLKLIDKSYFDSKKNVLSNIKNLIFLDIHGVLITDIKIDKNGDSECDSGWNDGAIKNLNELTNLTNAKIVIISDCKNRVKFKRLVNMLKKAGISGDIIDKTIQIHKTLRKEQIDNWFNLNGEPKNWVVIDDKVYDDYVLIPDNVIRPNPKIGFSEEDLELALNKFKIKKG